MSKALIFVIIQFLLFGVFAILLFALPTVSSALSTTIGLMMAVIGPILGLIAIHEHSTQNKTTPNVVPTPKAHTDLIDSGPYRLIRHPIYTGVLLTAFGSALAHGHPVVFVMAIALAIFFSIKSRYEETLLRQVFPGYREYEKQTGRFLPGL